MNDRLPFRAIVGDDDLQQRPPSAAGEQAVTGRIALLGWSPGGVETYTVALVTDPAEMERATR